MIVYTVGLAEVTIYRKTLLETCLSLPVASYDPIFYAHHCMIDRIWYLWQLEHGSTTGFEQLLDFPLAPFNLTVKDVIDIRDRGYDYAGDIQHVSVSVGMGG